MAEVVMWFYLTVMALGCVVLVALLLDGGALVLHSKYRLKRQVLAVLRTGAVARSRRFGWQYNLTLADGSRCTLSVLGSGFLIEHDGESVRAVNTGIGIRDSAVDRAIMREIKAIQSEISDKVTT